MLGPDGPAVLAERLLQRQLQDLLRFRAERDAPRTLPSDVEGARAEGLLCSAPDLGQIDADRLQRLGLGVLRVAGAGPVFSGGQVPVAARPLGLPGLPSRPAPPPDGREGEFGRFRADPAPAEDRPRHAAVRGGQGQQDVLVADAVVIEPLGRPHGGPYGLAGFVSKTLEHVVPLWCDAHLFVWFCVMP